MNQPITLCLIGAGNHATQHIYPCLSQLKGARVLANADLDEAKARQVAARFAIAASYGDYRQMLEAQRPDGVIVCVGPEFHGRTASELMRSGYAVYTEKPPAIDLAQMRQVRAAQRETGQIYLTGFKKRYAPAYRKTKEIIESERFGAPRRSRFCALRGPLARAPTRAITIIWSRTFTSLTWRPIFSARSKRSAPLGRRRKTTRSRCNLPTARSARSP